MTPKPARRAVDSGCRFSLYRLWDTNSLTIFLRSLIGLSLIGLDGEFFSGCSHCFVAAKQQFEPMPDKEPQQSDLLVYEPLVLGERMALTRLGKGEFSAPSVWVVASRCGRPLDLKVFLIRQPKRDVLRPFRFTHFVSPSLKKWS